MLHLTVRRIGLLVFCYLLTVAIAFASIEKNPLPAKTNYVVIGAFSYVKNAERFARFARDKKDMTAEFAKNPLRNLYYVYIYTSDDREEAVKEVLRTREENPELWDAWVFTGALGDFDPEAVQINSTSLSTSLSTDMSDETRSSTSEDHEEMENPARENEGQGKGVEGGEGSAQEAVTGENESIAENENGNELIVEEAPQEIEAEEGHYYLYFNTINKHNLKEVKGRVGIIDVERAKQITLEESHKIVDLKDPENGTNRIKLSTQIFGFKEVQHIIDLDQPINDSTANYVAQIGDSTIVDFELERFKKGDVLVMYNVYFFKDAAIMKPESKYELASLLDMLQENEKLKVRIHGHTNGGASGKIIHLDEEKNYFSLNAEQEEDYGSAKKLSLFRAETIEKWLVDQGVNSSRMSAKGWGGKKMIYDKHDTQAYKNVRVEIEIVED